MNRGNACCGLFFVSLRWRDRARRQRAQWVELIKLSASLSRFSRRFWGGEITHPPRREGLILESGRGSAPRLIERAQPHAPPGNWPGFLQTVLFYWGKKGKLTGVCMYYSGGRWVKIHPTPARTYFFFPRRRVPQSNNERGAPWHNCSTQCRAKCVAGETPFLCSVGAQVSYSHQAMGRGPGFILLAASH